jgi:glyoxylase-like metal-dependent hydrolase (beta-lactamase superfamily II)
VSDEGAPRSLGHGAHIVPVPLPIPGLSWVNAYVLESDRGLILVDCGVAWEEGFEALIGGIGRLGLDAASVTDLVVTHLHVDHVALAPRLVRELGCRLVMHSSVLEELDDYNDPRHFVATGVELAARHGAPRHEVDELGRIEPRPDLFPVVEAPAATVEDGDRISLRADRYLEVVHTPGHQRAHICLRDSLTGVLFSGDHLLPRITPIVPWNGIDPDPLGDYLGSLHRVSQLGIGLTYPAHGWSIERGDVRANQITAHHRRRLDDIADLLSSSPMTGWEVMTRHFRPNLMLFERRLALSETVAHLEHLRLRGWLSGFEEDGIVWYRRGSAG